MTLRIFRKVISIHRRLLSSKTLNEEDSKIYQPYTKQKLNLFWNTTKNNYGSSLYAFFLNVSSNSFGNENIPIRLTWNSTATMWSVAEQGRMVASGRRSPASAVRQYQKNRECQGRRLVLKYGSPIRTEIWKRDALHSLHWDTHFWPFVRLPKNKIHLGCGMCLFQISKISDGLNCNKCVAWQQDSKELKQY